MSYYKGKAKLDFKSIPDWVMELIEKSYSEVFLMPFGIEFSGFQKSGTAELVFEDGEWKLFSRYETINSINSIRDFLRCVLDWWEISRCRSDVWQEPPYEWQKLLLEYGLVKKKEKTISEWS